MPSRSNVQKVNTPVQGSDAWVIIKLPTYGDIRRLTNEIKDVGATAETLAQNMNFTAGMLRYFVMEWNWVDDEGNPLPQIQTNPEIIEQLTATEVQEICTYIFDAEAVKKNRVT